MKKIAVFASGNGSNFQAILDSIKRGDLHVELGLIVCDKPQAGVVERAKVAGIPVFSFVPKEYESKVHFEREIIAALQSHQIDLIFLAGYMRLIGSTLLDAYTNKIVNIHPSLLPAFPGKDAIGQAFKAGVKITGITIHYVDSGMDTGPIIAQKAIEVGAGDNEKTIADKIHTAEHELYPKVIQDLILK